MINSPHPNQNLYRSNPASANCFKIKTKNKRSLFHKNSKFIFSYMLAKTLHNLNSSNWVVGIIKNSALSTNMLYINSIINTATSAQWGIVISALQFRWPLHANVTSLTPTILSPTVLDKPVVSKLSISSIANKLDS